MLVSPLPRLLCRRLRSGAGEADGASERWRDAEPCRFRDNVPGQQAAQATQVRAVWSQTAWSLLFEMEDAQPWGTLTQRDGPLWTEEVVEVFVDPVGDLEGYFEVEINPLGTVVDLVLRRTRSGWRKDFAWRVEGLGSAVRPTANGWAAELHIPFASITSGPPVPGTSWRANFLRIDRPEGPGTEGVLSAWSPTGICNFHRSECFGTVEFAV